MPAPWLLATPDTFDGGAFSTRYSLNALRGDFWLEPRSGGMWLFLRSGVTIPDDPPILTPAVAPVYRQVFYGNASPEGVVRGSPGDAYFNGQGGSGSTFYVKESGVGTNTGWVAK